MTTGRDTRFFARAESAQLISGYSFTRQCRAGPIGMNAHGTTINILSTGIPGLDEVLCGGLPEFSFNLIAGPPGAGKTTLAH